MKFPFFKQPDINDCGPTCIKIISKFYGKDISVQKIRSLSESTRAGSNLLGLSNAAESLGFKTLGLKVSLQDLIDEQPFPSIIHWNKHHFVVVYKIKKKKDYFIHISDPAFGLVTYTEKEFLKLWIGDGATRDTEDGLTLLMEPTAVFSKLESDKFNNSGNTFFLKYILKYKSLLFQLFLGLLMGSLLSLVFPFLTQSMVDVGIKDKNIRFVYLILLAQMMLFLGKIGMEIVRSWILIHISLRINISLISDFFIKLMNLPVSFFDTKMTGDIMQRINDHQRIENLLTNTIINTVFSIITFVIYSLVLFYYNYQLSLVFFIGSFLYFLWIYFFLNKRKELDYKRFSQVSKEQSKVMEIINGMQEIKLMNAEKQKRWEWEFTQNKIFKTNVKSHVLELWQFSGGGIINQVKDIFLSFLSAKLVIDGEITLGMMLSVQYILGQLNNPLSQLVEFVKQVQDAKISVDRLKEIHNKKDETDKEVQYLHEVPQGDILIENLSFRYLGSNKFVFENLNLVIPQNKTTAIVGTSGSGKTTLLKLLLKFYKPNHGFISINSSNIENITHQAWRDNFGVVMQEGYIFNDTIANNICIGVETVDKQRLKNAVGIAQIEEYINSLPLSYNTMIGNEGISMSGGQKQRLLIARAVYKLPNFILFDEATSSLDANNEKKIIENLNLFFKNRTAVVIAHRLSTVKQADKIVVLNQGKIVEEGSHIELIKRKGEYFELIKNQLELND